jgi:predicted RNA-binding protein with PIN domain
VYYLIDGYNLLFRLLEAKKSLESERDVIIRSLQIEFSLLDLKGTIVFDAHKRQKESRSQSYNSPLIIAYTQSGETADQYILEKLETAQAPSEIAVVTDDRFLAGCAKAYQAKVLHLNAFLSLLEKKQERRRQKKEDRLDERPFHESKRETERLFKVFEERLTKSLAD